MGKPLSSVRLSGNKYCIFQLNYVVVVALLVLLCSITLNYHQMYARQRDGLFGSFGNEAYAIVLCLACGVVIGIVCVHLS